MGETGLKHFQELLNALIDDLNNMSIDALNTVYFTKAMGKIRLLLKAIEHFNLPISEQGTGYLYS